jgi:hypothetical protein
MSKIKRPELPEFLKGLPRTTFVRRQAKTYEESTEPDIIFGVESLDSLADKMERRQKAAPVEKKKA